MHECRDYAATLKHYKLSLAIEINTSGVMTLEQIAQLASTDVPGLRVAASSGSTSSTNPGFVKLKPKLVESLEDRRRALEVGALTSAAQQQALHITSMAALAGAATMLHCLPIAPQPLNPLVKPLMEAIKREEDEELQKLAAKHLAHLVNLCVHRIPCPNAKVGIFQRN
jgi:TATA-binding protein-associated factor